MKKNKFYKPTPFKERLVDFFKSLPFWKGRKKGMIHTRDIEWNDIRCVFFPRTFQEKYEYLGCIPWKSESDIFQVIEPLIIFMDHKARPWWCPRWVLRFLHLFGSDNSIVRVRNRTLHNLEQKLTKGILMTDYKTKWADYDLRLHIHGTKQMNWLADAIEDKYYRDGRKEYLKERLSELTGKSKESYNFKMLRELEDEYIKVIEDIENKVIEDIENKKNSKDESNL
jgi:uncharacterized FlaG/YvyC family protein